MLRLVYTGLGASCFSAMSYESLTGKRKLFVDAYLGRANCNRSEAARLAGYTAPPQEGYRLWKDTAVRAAIDERMRELAIGPEEILARLSEHARGDMAEFITVDETGGFRIDLSEAEKAGKLRLVKKAGYDQKGRPAIELYDAQSALLALAKRYSLFPDRQELSGPDGKPIQVGISFEDALLELRKPVDVPEPEDDAADTGGGQGI